MKRQQRKWHLTIWLVLLPVMLGTLYLAWTVRTDTPVTDPLPTSLQEEIG